MTAQPLLDCYDLGVEVLAACCSLLGDAIHRGRHPIARDEAAQRDRAAA